MYIKPDFPSFKVFLLSVNITSPPLCNVITPTNS